MVMKRFTLTAILVLTLIGVVLVLYYLQRDDRRDVGGRVPARQAIILPAAANAEGLTRSISQVYYNAFDGDAAGPEWSSRKISVTKKGKRRYLGNIPPNDPVTLGIAGLPAHKLLRISFDLLLMKSWDGSSPYYGDTVFDLHLGDGRSLIHTTFGNCGFFSGNNEQAFPDTYPARPYPSWTGAAEFMTLGAMQKWDNTYDTSSVYRLCVTCPHADSGVTFSFGSTMPGSPDTKSFGLANVRVEAISDFVSRTQGELAQMWADLGSARYPLFYQAQWDLIESGDDAVSYLSSHVHESDDLSDQDIREVIHRYRQTHRPELLRTLVMQGKAAIAPIDEALGPNQVVAPDRRELLQCKELVTRYPQSATELRLSRARQLLQIIHSDAAMKLAEQAGK
jgi:hypothetical protein